MSKSYLISLLLAIVFTLTTYKYMELKQEVKSTSEETVSPREAILSVIHNRKSVRFYLDKPVHKDDLMTIMKAGMAAPTGIDTRPWKFIAITDSNIIKALGQDSPATIAFCADLNKLDERAPEFWITDTSVATQNMLLAIEGMGLGAVWRSVYPWKDYMAQVSEVLNVPQSVRPLCILTIGYPTGNEKAKDKYDPSNIHWQIWQEVQTGF